MWYFQWVQKSVYSLLKSVILFMGNIKSIVDLKCEINTKKHQSLHLWEHIHSIFENVPLRNTKRLIRRRRKHKVTPRTMRNLHTSPLQTHLRAHYEPIYLRTHYKPIYEPIMNPCSYDPICNKWFFEIDILTSPSPSPSQLSNS